MGFIILLQRDFCAMETIQIFQTEVESGLIIIWKYPSLVLRGDTGTKLIDIGKNSMGMIVSKGISTSKLRNCYRGLVHVQPDADNERNVSV